jgi:hypothetical protein
MPSNTNFPGEQYAQSATVLLPFSNPYLPSGHASQYGRPAPAWYVLTAQSGHPAPHTWYFPGTQVEHAVCPGPARHPTLHAPQIEAPVPFWNVSSPQIVHPLAPAPEYTPTPHAVQFGALPSASHALASHGLNFPASQFRQSLVFVRHWYLPCAHVTHSSWPTTPWDFPTAHAVHAVALVRLFTQPTGQGTHADPPVVALYVPGEHARHTLWPTLNWYRPALHRSHRLAPDAVW